MITRRIAIFAALSVAFYPVLPALPASDPDLLAGLDTDHDGTVSLDEAKKAAEVMFDKRGRLSAREFTVAPTMTADRSHRRDASRLWGLGASIDPLKFNIDKSGLRVFLAEG
jgi:hypothetical protein